MNPNHFWRMFEDEWFTPKYRLKKLLGAGAFGAVFLADEVISDRVLREVAIKIFSGEGEPQERQIAELQTAISLKHPGLLEGFTPEQGWLKGVECLGLVMELAQESLTKRLQRGVLPILEVKAIAKNLAGALHYLHEKGIVHRDLKPANIMQVGEQWKLTDFGISRFLQNRNGSDTSPSNQVGTIAYAPPESYRGKISLAWDLWSLGVAIAEMLTGKHPFEGETPQELMHRVTHEEPDLPELPSPFAAIVQGCLVKDYTQRWTASQVLVALEPSAELGRVTVLLPLSPSFRRAIPTAAGETGCVSIPVSGIEMRSPEADWQVSRGAEEQVGVKMRKIFLPARQYQERLPGAAMLDMIAIPAGNFFMGTSTEDIEQVLKLETWFTPFAPEEYLLACDRRQERKHPSQGNRLC